MNQIHKSPRNLADAVCGELSNRKKLCPDNELVSELFEILYYTSLRTEEGHVVRCHVVWLDPARPDPKPPQRIVHNRWNFVPFGDSLPFDTRTLTKIAEASDPRTSSFAVYPDKNNELRIWGLIDQGNTFHDFLHFDSTSGPERPGLFQASIVGIGRISAYLGFDRIAELVVNELFINSHRVLTQGPIRKRLQPAITEFVENVKAELPEGAFEERNHWTNSLQNDWLATLRRILLRSQNYGHGGAILITPDESCRWLDIKYRIDYDRIVTAIHRKAIHQIMKTTASDIIHDEYMEEEESRIPTDLYLGESVESFLGEESEREIDGIIWFISLLTRVDGLVLLRPNLSVKGFGAVITSDKAPPQVFSAGNALGTKSKLLKMEYDHFGTRHRSMMRYCNAVPGSIGFVISQDGDVRVMTKVGENLIVWENIRLRNESAALMKRRRTPTASVK